MGEVRQARGRCLDQQGRIPGPAARRTGDGGKFCSVVRRARPVATAQSAEGSAGMGAVAGLSRMPSRATSGTPAGSREPPPTVPSYSANSTSPAGAVALAIAGGEDGPAVWQAVFAQGAIEHQLIAGGLDQRRRGVQFVEEQDAGTVLGQERRNGPGRPALLDRRQPTRSTGSSKMARISIRRMPSAVATCATTWDLPTPGGPKRKAGLWILRQQLQRGCDFRRLHGRRSP